MPIINLSFQHIKITTPTIYSEEKDRPSGYVRSYQQCQQTILQQYWSIGRSIHRSILMQRCKKREAKIISSVLDLQYLILFDSWWMPQGLIRRGFDSFFLGIRRRMGGILLYGHRDIVTQFFSVLLLAELHSWSLWILIYHGRTTVT